MENSNDFEMFGYFFKDTSEEREMYLKGKILK